MDSATDIQCRIHFDEGLTLETSVFESSRWLIYLIDLVVDN